jgi:hypothetical protein
MRMMKIAAPPTPPAIAAIGILDLVLVFPVSFEDVDDPKFNEDPELVGEAPEVKREVPVVVFPVPAAPFAVVVTRGRYWLVFFVWDLASSTHRKPLHLLV